MHTWEARQQISVNNNDINNNTTPAVTLMIEKIANLFLNIKHHFQLRKRGFNCQLLASSYAELIKLFGGRENGR
jgi:hypothetical protein